MPAEALVKPPPLSVPPDGFASIASEMPAVLVVTRLLCASSTLTVTEGTIDWPTPTLVGCCPKASFVGVPTV